MISKVVRTAYNPLNGIHCSENEFLLKKVLRGEWRWRGLVVSDWGGTHSTASAIRAGLDLEMPQVLCIIPINPLTSLHRAETIWRTPRQLISQLECGKLHLDDIRGCARNVLEMANTAIASNIPFADDHGACDTEKSRALLKESAAKTITLLKNQDHVLPLKAKTLGTLAVIGDCASICNSSGGGSAAVPLETYQTSPLEAITEIANECGIRVSHEQGPRHYKYTPVIDRFLGHRAKSKSASGLFEAWMRQPHPEWKSPQAKVDTSSPDFSVDHSPDKICFLDTGYGDPRINTDARFVKVRRTILMAYAHV